MQRVTVIDLQSVMAGRSQDECHVPTRRESSAPCHGFAAGPPKGVQERAEECYRKRISYTSADRGPEVKRARAPARREGSAGESSRLLVSAHLPGAKSR